MQNKLTPDTDIHNADFTIRTLNVIKSSISNDWWIEGRKIDTLRDLSGYSEEEVFCLKGSGKKVFYEIKSVLNQAGLTFSEKSNRMDWNGYNFNKFKIFKNFIGKKLNK